MKSQHALAKARPQNVRPPAAGTAQEPRRESRRGAATRNTGPVAEALSSFISNGCRRAQARTRKLLARNTSPPAPAHAAIPTPRRLALLVSSLIVRS